MLRGSAAVAILLLLACGVRAPASNTATATAPAGVSAREAAFLDTLAERTFRWFWDTSDARTGLTPDRWPTKSFVSVGAMGFALTAYPIGAENEWVSRRQAAQRTLATLRFMWSAPQDTSMAGVIGYKGFYYHFLHPASGQRFEDVELSTMDTALFLAGVLFCQSYFDGDDLTERSVRAIADSIYRRVDWNWAQPRPPLVVHGWKPRAGYLPYDWGGFNEAMILQVLALGSPTHPADAKTWEAWTRGYRWGTFQGQEHLGFAPLFGHQYAHVWIDFRGIADAYMREKGIDYFENSRRATLAQRAYAIENPGKFTGYGERLWGLTACDGPVEREVVIDGRKRQFHTYTARGASFTEVNDDGTISPTAAASSLPFAPEVVAPALVAMREHYGPRLFGRYGFVDAFNPTLRQAIPVQHGVVDTTLGWFDTDYLGIDQGPILAMIENHRSGLVWRTMRKNPHLIRGLERAGFRGGWLDSVATTR